MKSSTSKPVQINRRRFLSLIGFAGCAGVCWQTGLFSPRKELQVVRQSQPIMGTILNLTLYGPDRDACQEAIRKTIDTMSWLESKLSRHQTDSELASLNATGGLVAPSTHLLAVLELAAELNRKSEGAFDPTILPLLARREAGVEFTDPEFKNLVGFSKVIVGKDRAELLQPGMSLSLDGIGKGYIVDKGAETLAALGFSNVIVDAGGDLMVGGTRQGTTPWRIGIQSPRPGRQHKPMVFPVSNRAVATSGDYMQAFTSDFQEHHIIDPHVGKSPTELASCTVTAPTVALADGLATAVMVLGRAKGLELIESIEGCEAYLIGKDRGHPQALHTTGFFS